ncbi:MAG: transposase [Oscillospiraceae bacterium]|nr:transposase [Oscillospiraceae bacterium]
MQKELPVRKNIRLQGYDYSASGCYYITICVKNRHEILWKEYDSVGARIARPLSAVGNVVKTAIENIPKIYDGVYIDIFAVMPNHIHMIARIENSGRAMRAPTVSRIINQFKGYVTKQIGFSIWQKLFYDEIIRNEQTYRNIWQYINENPEKWAEDEFY